MEENLIIDSIRKEKLQLELFEKFKYFKVSLLCIFISFISLTQGFQNFSDFTFSDVTSKVGCIFLILGIISLIIKTFRLKLISVVHSIPNVKESVINLAKERNWVTEFKNDKVIILKTIPIRNYSDYLIYNRNEGEKIYIFLNQKKVLLRSIDNLDNFALKIQNGENSANESAIINKLKASR